MGTRALTFVYDEGKPVACLYRQFDGYMSGHGRDLAKFLSSFQAITNGIAAGEKRKTANGMGCLAAQMIANFKTEVGGFYLYPTNTKDAGQDYTYHVYEDMVEVRGYSGNLVFRGSWDEFAIETGEVIEA